MLPDIGPAALTRLRAQMTWVEIAGGQTLMAQGEPGDAMYLLGSGRLRTYIRQDDGSQRVVREVSRGQVVGELAGDEVSETGIGRMMINATTLRRTDGAEPVRLLERRPTCGAASGAATMCRAAPSSPAAC